MKVCDNPALSKSTSIIFLTAFAHIMSVCHILGNLCNISDFFIIILFVVVICDQCLFDVTVVIVLESHKLCPHETVNLIDKCVCSDCSTDRHYPISLSLSLSLSIPSLTTIFK